MKEEIEMCQVLEKDDLEKSASIERVEFGGVTYDGVQQLQYEGVGIID